MKFNISEKDKRSLIVLVLFLAAAGYYYFLFDPVYAKWKTANAALKKVERELINVQRKVRERGRWQRDRDRLSERMEMINAKVKMPSSDTELSERVKAIMDAARRASVKVTNLRPMPRTLEDGKTKMVDTFSIDGAADMHGVVSFLDNLWGMKVGELSLSMSEDKERPVKFYGKIASLPPWEFKSHVDSGKSPGVKITAFKLSGDPFYPKQRLAPVSRPRSAEKVVKEDISPPPLPKPTVVLAGLRLVGISDIGGKKMAIVVDDSAQKDLFLREGDTVRDYTVSGISDVEVVFKAGEGVTGTIRLPERPKDVIEVSSKEAKGTINKGAKESPGKARIGISVKALTPEHVKEKGIEVESGLIVSKVDERIRDVFVDDVITSINGIKTSSVGSASKILKNMEVGEDVELEIIRNGEQSRVKVKTF